MLLNFTRKVGETKKDAAIDVQRQENNLSIFQSFVVGCYTDFLRDYLEWLEHTSCGPQCSRVLTRMTPRIKTDGCSSRPRNVAGWSPSSVQPTKSGFLHPTIQPKSGWWFGTFCVFPIQLGISSSQLPN